MIYLFHNKSPLYFFLLHYKLVSVNTVTLFSLHFLCSFRVALFSDIYVGKEKKKKRRKIFLKSRYILGKLHLGSAKLVLLISVNYIFFNINILQSSLLLTLCFISSVSEKKKEKEREELWKKLEDLELKRGLRRDGIIPT